MSGSIISKIIGTFIFNRFWPWFLKHAWPVIKNYVLKKMVAALQVMHKQLTVATDRSMRSREEEALQRAAAAEATAKAVESETARSEAEAVARVWREVAEQFRQENEDLKAKLDQAAGNAYESVQISIENSEPVLDQLDGEPTLVIGGRTITLPALPLAAPKSDA